MSTLHVAPRPPQERGSGGTRLKVLVLDEFLPWPTDAGKTIRTWNLLAPLARRHDVTLLCHGDVTDPATMDAKTKVENARIRVELAGALRGFHGARLYARLLANCLSEFPYSVEKHTTAAFRARLELLLRREQFDLVHCEWTPYARYMLENSAVPFVIDAHNLEALIWQRRSQSSRNPAEKLFFALQAKKMRRFEARAFAAAHAIAAVSEIEAEGALSWGARHSVTVPNGVDVERFQPAYTGRSNEFLFLGSLDWFPNEDAVLYLADKLIPSLRELHPEARFRIVGRRPTVALRSALAGCEEIALSADVADVRPYLQKAAALVVPLRIGGGTRIKILEAMASGCPVISSRVGCEGLAVRDRENMLIANTEREFATACATVLGDPQFARRLALAGRQLVEERYSWTSAAEKLQELWHTVAARQLHG